MPTRGKAKLSRNDLKGFSILDWRFSIKEFHSTSHHAPPARNPMNRKKREGQDRLILFCRYPVPGRAKTRLIPALGPLCAADLHRRLAERAFRTVQMAAASLGAGVEVRFDGREEKRMRNWLGGPARFARQGPGDLGRRMQVAFAEAFQGGCPRVVLLGADVPGIAPRHLEAAAQALWNHDLVLGPSTDGGYWLIGMKRVLDVFRGVQWGAAAVLAQSLEAARTQGLSVHLMEPESDMDTIDDIRLWQPEEAEARPYVSVIIPALNEAERIPAAVASALHAESEVIVVDGGSRDRTVEAAREAGARVISSRAGRAVQQNRGAASARGSVLLFLHADTRLPEDYTAEVFDVLMDRRVAAGAFRFRTDLHGPLMRGIEIGANLRAEYLKLPYGDQALFMRKEVFDAVAGFPDQPIAEDLALVRRLWKRGGIGIASADAVTSGRRWDTLGILRTTLINWVIACGCLAGISAHRLAPLYRIRGKRRPEEARPSLISRANHREAQ